MNKPLALLLCTLVMLTSCAQVDESTLVTDDNGVVHRTKHYLKDTRGRDVFPEKVKATGDKRFIFDPRAHAWAAYDEEGNRLMTGSASGGKVYCDDIGQACHTVVGNFKVYHRRGEGCRSGQYPVETFGGAKMPYCMYFYRGYTIHAAYEVPDDNVSHGCIRVLPSAAKWLYDNFMTLGTKVVVMPYPDESAESAV